MPDFVKGLDHAQLRRYAFLPLEVEFRAHGESEQPLGQFKIAASLHRFTLGPVIYLDYNATAPLAPAVKKAIESCWSELWGNPSSTHQLGREAKAAMRDARRAVADLIGATEDEVVFTSGATESNNTAVFAAHRTFRGSKLVTTAVEHASVRGPCAWLREQGATVSEVPVDESGRLDLGTFERQLPGATLASVIWVNNETGVISPIEEVAALCAEHHVPLHVDAVQAVGKIPINLDAGPKIDYLALSGHKIGAPKGIGALYIRSGSPYQSMFFGGEQERFRRPGTENLLSAIGLGVAATAAAGRLSSVTRLARLRDEFERNLKGRIPGCKINGAGAARVCNTTNVSMPVEDGEALLMLLDQRGVLASSGSACHSASLDPSHVLLAMGIDRRRAKQSVRFSLGFDTTADEVAVAIDTISTAVGLLTGVPTA